MGIYGLTTYLWEHRSSLARARTFDGTRSSTHRAGSSVEAERTPIVVDGWSFIFEVTNNASSDLPWVYGGEYATFSSLVQRVVQAWIDVGLSVHFVFDGPYPPLKFPTLISRAMHTSIQHGLLFFRTSAAARATPRFLNETKMLPPLMYTACVQALLEMADHPEAAGALRVHFADEEGDPYAVALAGRLHAYVAGRDSDFLVLNSDGYQGYIPLDEMVWNATLPPSSRDPSVSASGSAYSESAFGDVDDEDANGFRTVRSAKSRKRAAVAQRAGRGLIPPGPEELSGAALSLSVTVFAPTTLAAHLELPVSLLPLLGALVGNDFTGVSEDMQRSTGGKQDIWRLFFERRLTPVQRITRAAGALRGILASAFPTALKKKRGKPVGSVMELIDAAVTALLLRADGLAMGEREVVVERIVVATLQYALPRYEGPGEGAATSTWASDVCALHTHETCPLLAVFSRRGQPNSRESNATSSVSDIGLDWAPSVSEEPLTDAQADASVLLISAYRRGALDPHAVDALSTGTSWPRHFLEDPDKESVLRSIGRPLREWRYTLLDAGTQTGVEDGEDDAIEQEEDDDDDDEVVSVREEDDEDLLAPLRGALQQLDGSTVLGALSSPLSSTSPNTPPVRPKLVVEYVRRGTRLATEDVPVPPLSDILALVPDLDIELSLPVQLWSPDARLTLLLRLLRADTTHIRALKREQRTAVLAVRWTVQRMYTRSIESAGNKERDKERWTRAEAHAFLAAFSAPGVSEEAETLPLEERNVQLVAQILSALDAIEQLVQVMLLSDEVPSPARYFSGRQVHSFLTGTLVPAALENGTWEACVDELENVFAEPRGPKGKKERRKKEAAPARGQVKAPAKGGLYGLLASMDH